MSAWLHQRRTGGQAAATASSILLGHDAPTFKSEFKREYTEKQSEMGSKKDAARIAQQKQDLAKSLRRENWEYGRAKPDFTTSNRMPDPRKYALPSAKLSAETMRDLRKEHFSLGSSPMEWRSTAQSDYFSQRDPAAALALARGDNGAASDAPPPHTITNVELGRQPTEFYSEAQERFAYDPAAFRAATQATRQSVIDNNLKKSNFALGFEKGGYGTTGHLPDPRQDPAHATFRGVFNESKRHDLQGTHYAFGSDRGDYLTEARKQFVRAGEPFGLRLLRQQLVSECGTGAVKAAALLMAEMDADGSGYLSRDEFYSGLRRRFKRVQLTGEQLEELFRHVDTDRDGSVDRHELVEALRGELAEERQETLEAAWLHLRPDAEGAVTVAELRAAFRPEGRPEVVRGQSTAEEEAEEMVQHFLGVAIFPWGHNDPMRKRREEMRRSVERRQRKIDRIALLSSTNGVLAAGEDGPLADRVKGATSPTTGRVMLDRLDSPVPTRGAPSPLRRDESLVAEESEGRVTFGQFCDYYRDFSIATPRDKAFFYLVRSDWGLL